MQGFCLTLLSELRSDQHVLVTQHIKECLKVTDQIISAHPPTHAPTNVPHKIVGSFWLEYNPRTSHIPEGYILTESVKKNLKNLARAISAK